MSHTKMLKLAMSAYIACALLAFLATAFSGGFSDAHIIQRVWIFPLRFEFALVLLFLSLLASYSLLHDSLHGRLLLTAIAVVHILNMIFATSLVESSIAALFSAASMMSLGLLVYVAWTNPQSRKVKRLQRYQVQRRRAKEEQDKIDYAYLTALPPSAEQHPEQVGEERHY
ncbi:hypothetical protein SNR37_004113 [Agarivorans aestuarii]|uniref:Uncharacterized protein n=1 Tax=Agarivorans aestuarii TaxID=1563703 RepID=A0ABU7G5V6_9ALTE|nr:hypothetical protein [Agarivorans aestuarii]MEE1674670.1 hypothetical protein [Agarivorans aestuarii]